jgi:hypothetical protein
MGKLNVLRVRPSTSSGTAPDVLQFKFKRSLSLSAGAEHRRVEGPLFIPQKTKTLRNLILPRVF